MPEERLLAVGIGWSGSMNLSKHMLGVGVNPCKREAANNNGEQGGRPSFLEQVQKEKKIYAVTMRNYLIGTDHIDSEDNGGTSA
jgi:hypothetical protein